MRKMFSVVGFLFSLFVLSACNYEKAKVITEPTNTSGNSRYLVIQKNIVEPKCLKCHSANSPSDGIDLSSYASIMSSKTVSPGKPQESRFYTSVVSGNMPRGQEALSSGELDLIQQWIMEGAREVEVLGSTPTPIPPLVETATANYQWISKNIFQAKCLICHNTAKPRGKVDFSSYEALIASAGNKTKPVIAGNAEESTLYVEIAEQKMPPTIKSLNADEVKALYVWILAGAAPSVIVPPAPGPMPPAGPPQADYAWLSKNIFSRRCGSCHGIPYKVAKVDFTSYETLLSSPGKNGKALIPGDPEHSAIYNEVVSGHMPPPRKVMTADEIRVVKQWIEEGAQNN